MNIKIERSKQSGAALIVALVALLVLTFVGVRTMSDVMSQSSVVRNEQFRQKVFYAASSELNVQIDAVNMNTQSEDDPIIDALLNTRDNDGVMELNIEDDGDEDGVGAGHKTLTDPDDVNLTGVVIKANRRDQAGCPGESIGKVKVIAGDIDTTASLDDGRANNKGSIKSSQRQRYVYCWP